MSPASGGKKATGRSQARAGARSRRHKRSLAEAHARAQAQRRRRMWMIGGSLLIALPVVLAVALSGVVVTQSASSTTTRPVTRPVPSTIETTGHGQPTTGPTLLTSLPPWPIPTDAAPFIAAAGLHAQNGETLQVHYHAHLDIIDSGSHVTVPAEIGFLKQNGQEVGLTSLHTHDTSGIVHIESATDVPYTLGQVFTEWGVRLTASQVGGLVSGNGHVVRVYVNGTVFTGDPATIVLRPHQEIAFWYGSTTATAQIPTSYAFPKGD